MTAALASHAPRWGQVMRDDGNDDHEGHRLLNVLMRCTGIYKSELTRQLS